MFGQKDHPQQAWLNRGMWQRGTGDSWIKVFWALRGSVNVSSVPIVMQGLTTSINSVLRSDGDASNSGPARGVVLVNQTCVGVVWAWLALPLTLGAWTVSLLALTIIQCQIHNRRRGIQRSRSPWKTSTLPLLWCGLPDFVKEQYSRLDSMEQMKSISDELKLMLDAGGQVDSETELNASDSNVQQR